MIICSINDIEKSYGGNTIFQNLSFEIHEGSRLGIVGRNGSGKTTLLKLIANEEAVDMGVIHWKKGLKIGYLAQIPQFEQLNVFEVLKSAFKEVLETEAKLKELENQMGIEMDPDNMQPLINLYGKLQDEFLQNGGYEIDANIDRVVNGLHIMDLVEKPFSLLSGGEKTKVCLALNILKKPELLLLDEPTNHLDLHAVEWLESFLKDYEGSVVMISHDRYFLDQVATKIVDMEDGEIEVYHTNFSGYVKEKEERLLREFQEYQEQQRKIKKMKEAIKRLRDWANRSNPPSAALHKRATNMERALERMEKKERPKIDVKKMAIDFEAKDRSGKDVIYLKDVSKSFDNRLLFNEVNMLVQYKERVAIVGENGTGKSTLVKMMLNELSADSGEIRVGSNVKIGYLSQHVFNQISDESLIDVFRSEVSVNEGEARHILAKFLFYGPVVFRKVNQLSGGERMRLRLAQLMHQDVNLLVLDEPTNHLDIDSCEVLEEALEGFNGTILAVSHDRYFLNKLFSKIYWLENGKIHSFNGDYNWAKDKLSTKKMDEAKKPIQVIKTTDSITYKPKKGKDESGKSIEVLEKQLEELESTIHSLHQKMNSLKELEDLQKLHKEIEEMEKLREKLYDELDQVC
ncbi:ribosomal protection-like ABC-F family protein [Bacillus sp. CGMCC 1.16607]|uniref:ribosomal protection-like ABC-F family protein n=1 Tax=Bacillus sp. CGMCC 1.16607 TaxID=3351842 RepID=UPI00363C74CF